MWTPNPFPVKIASVPLGGEKAPLVIRVEVGPRIPIPGWPAASFTAWAENQKGESVNMPFVAQVSEKQPWVMFNIPGLPAGTEQIIIKARNFPTAFAAKQVRTEPGTGKDPRPSDWKAPTTPGERMQKAGQALGMGMITGGIAGLVALALIVALAIWLLPKVIKYL